MCVCMYSWSIYVWYVYVVSFPSYVCMHVHMCIHTHARMYCVVTQTHVCMYVRVYFLKVQRADLLHAYMLACIHSNINADGHVGRCEWSKVSSVVCIHTYMHTYTHTHIHTHIHAYIHTYMHTYKHTCVHTHIHAYIRTYMQLLANALKDFFLAYTYVHIHTHTCSW